MSTACSSNIGNETMMKQFKKLGRGGMLNPLKLEQMFGGNLPF